MRPPCSRMTLCALTSRCTSPAPWTAASARHRLRAMSVASSPPSGPSEWTISASERPRDQLHPQSDLPADLLRTVDGDDIRVSHTGQHSAFREDRRRGVLRGHVDDFQGDLPRQHRIPGAIDPPERTVSYLLEEVKVCPRPEPAGRVFRRGHDGIAGGGRRDVAFDEDRRVLGVADWRGCRPRIGITRRRCAGHVHRPVKLARVVPRRDVRRRQ